MKKQKGYIELLNPFPMEMFCKLSPVVVLFIFCSFDAVMNVSDNSWKHCDPLYMYVVLLFLLCNNNKKTLSDTMRKQQKVLIYTHNVI